VYRVVHSGSRTFAGMSSSTGVTTVANIKVRNHSDYCAVTADQV